MVTDVGTFGRHLKVSSYHARVPLLNKELTHTEELLKGQRDQSGDLDTPFCLMDGRIEKEDP